MSPTARQTRSLWEDSSTEYSQDAPSVQRAARSERWKRRTIGFLAFAAVPLCLVTAMSAYQNASRANGTVDPSTISTGTNDSPGKASAYGALIDWISAEPAPMPGAMIISWDGYSVENAPDPEDGKKPYLFRFESHTFSLLRDGLSYIATVQVAVDDAGAATAIGTPSIVQAPTLEVENVPVSWFGLTAHSAPEAVTQAVESWAEAYASGDPTLLRRAIQDGKAGRSYMPMAGVEEVRNVRVTAAGFDPDLGGNSGRNPTTIVVRVTLSYVWAGQEADQDGKTSNSSSTPVTYDLLVLDADTANPYVVAWGGIGTGAELEPYMNAVDGVELKVPSSSGSTSTAPTPTPGSSDDPDSDDDGGDE